MALPITSNIVTGFLGSGKTTLIRHVLRHGLRNERVAVIMNEMADIGIDGRVLQSVNVDKMIELSSGCICCSGFLQLGIAIQEIVETADPTLLLIETSGVAEIAPLVAELRSVGLRADAVITVVDAENLSKLLRESEAALEQIENADFLVLNKTDLVSPPAVEEAKNVLRRINERALLFKTQFSALETDLLFASSARRHRELAERNGSENHVHSASDGFESFVYEARGRLDRARFERFLKKLPGNTYRSKGLVHFKEETHPSLFNYVCGRYSFDWITIAVADPFVNQAVFIGRDITRLKNKILSALDLCRAG